MARSSGNHGRDGQGSKDDGGAAKRLRAFPGKADPGFPPGNATERSRSQAAKHVSSPVLPGACMTTSIARYLKDFGDAQPAGLAFGDPLADTDSVSPFADAASGFDEFESVDVENERQAAYARGHEDATREITEKMQAERDELLAAHSAELEALRTAYLEEIAVFLSRGLREGIDAIAATLSEQTAAILAPVLTKELSLKAVSALADVVRASMPDGDAVTLVVKGPKDLFEQLKTQPGFEEETMKFTETADIDLSVELGESVFVTRMSAWASSLRKVMK
ncbi:hypothetical protein SZ54_3549 [Rhizobium sp. UR51a]|nr:hypothetical protein SZ54_3549 [Rhizobium sp. UR51a]